MEDEHKTPKSSPILRNLSFRNLERKKKRQSLSRTVSITSWKNPEKERRRSKSELPSIDLSQKINLEDSVKSPQKTTYNI